jgi:RND family efflux transporter MFP subunit
MGKSVACITKIKITRIFILNIKNKDMKKWISISVIVLLVLLIVGRLAANKKEIDSKKEYNTEVKSVVVNTVSVGKQAPMETMALVGTAEAYQDVMVPAEAAGSITGVYFKLGDYVNKGAVLASIDDKYKTLALESAQLAYDKAKDDYERYKNMHAGEAVSDAQLRDAKIGFENTKIQLEQAKRQLRDTKVRAPFSGYITSKNVELGGFVNVSTPIAGIANTSQLKVMISVSESDVYLLKEGQSVSITAKVYPDVVYNGKISHISPKGDQSHTYPIEIVINNNTKNPLKAGTYINASIERGSMQPVLAIPRNSIISSIKDPSVYLVEGENVKLTRITIGKDLGKHIEVLDGLKEGDVVVTNGQINLMDGSNIRIAQNGTN